MALYFEVTEHSLEDARPGLILVEQLLQDENFRPYLYGITTKPEVLLAATAALQDDAGEDEEITVPELTEVAVAIPFGSDTVYYLEGSGLLLQNEEFAYL